MQNPVRTAASGVGRIQTVLLSLWLLAVAHPVHAQSDTGVTDVPDRFVIETGGAQMFLQTSLSLNSPIVGGSTVSLERDLKLSETAHQGYVEGFWRPARRHQVSVNFYRMDRTGAPTTVARDFTWAGAAYQIGATAVPRMRSDSLSAVYRWGAYSHSRIELGPAIGVGYLWVNASIATAASAGGPQGTTSITLERHGQADTPTGNLGGFVNWWPVSRVYVRGDLRYMLIKPNDREASITQGRASLTWYPWRHLGFGGQYTYDKFRDDLTQRSTELGGEYRYDGFQVLASARF
jgi:hypothetical protein